MPMQYRHLTPQSRRDGHSPYRLARRLPSPRNREADLEAPTDVEHPARSGSHCSRVNLRSCEMRTPGRRSAPRGPEIKSRADVEKVARVVAGIVASPASDAYRHESP